jgi:hypothetical protein
MHNGRLFLFGALAVTGLMFGSNPAHGQAAGTLNTAFGKVRDRNHLDLQSTAPSRP